MSYVPPHKRNQFNKNNVSNKSNTSNVVSSNVGKNKKVGVGRLEQIKEIEEKNKKLDITDN